MGFARPDRAQARAQRQPHDHGVLGRRLVVAATSADGNEPVPGIEPLGGLVGLAHLQQDVRTACPSSSAHELGEHARGQSSATRRWDGGYGQQVGAGQAAGVVEPGVSQEPRLHPSSVCTGLHSGIIGLDNDVVAVGLSSLGGLQLGGQQASAPGLGPEQLALKAGDGIKWVAGKAANGVKWASGKLAQGAQWLGDKVTQGAQKIGSAISHGVQKVGNALAGIGKTIAGWF